MCQILDPEFELSLILNEVTNREESTAYAESAKEMMQHYENAKNSLQEMNGEFRKLKAAYELTKYVTAKRVSKLRTKVHQWNSSSCVPPPYCQFRPVK